MTITPTLASPDSETDLLVISDPPPAASEALAKPFRLGLIGLGASIGLFARLSAANGFGDLDSRSLMLAAAFTSFLMGLGLAVTAAERDRFGPPLIWLTAVTAAAWGTLNWISPPFGESVTVWSNSDQIVLAVLGVGNGLLLAGLVALALVRRGPTLTVAATLIAGVAALVSNTLLLRNEWPAIITLGAGFALILLAWDRSPRREPTFVEPPEPPRVSRAALSFISVALCGTALQLWVSRTDIPRSLPAVGLCVLLIIGAFASMIRVRREIEQRETTLSEWTSWMREIRTNDFRSEIQTFDSTLDPVGLEAPPTIGFDGEAPRKLSFPNLVLHDSPESDLDLGIDLPRADDAYVDNSPASNTEFGIKLPTADAPDPDRSTQLVVPQLQMPTADIAANVSVLPETNPTAGEPIALPRVDLAPTKTSGAFSAILGAQVADLGALERWLHTPSAAGRTHPLLVAIEALSLDEFESLPPEDAAMARHEIGRYLADIMPTADLVSWIDGPYFIVAHPSQPVNELGKLNKSVQAALRSTNGIHAFLRPGDQATIDEIVDEAVIGILQARQLETSAGR